VEQVKNYFHLHLISDSTGETLMAAGRAAAAQFQGAQALEHVYPLIRTRKAACLPCSMPSMEHPELCSIRSWTRTGGCHRA
jgi:regulator of PEP synthase PpsR (kinase-PPPase family)